jgi:surface polysaccharide O-acyltransferase-like enzyme
MAPSRRAAVLGALPDASNGGDRLVSLDNLRVVLIAAIIAMHAVLGYTTFEVWTYSWLREATLHPAVEAGLILVVLPFGLVLMALFFLVAGLLSVPSVQRKGPGRFARDRLVRLGIPFLVYVLLIQPVTVYALEHPLGGAPGSFWAEFLGDEGVLDSGPLWFVGALLVYSLTYAAWVRFHRGQAPAGRRITVRRLALVAVVVAPASFAIRLIWPYGSEAGLTDLNFWQWPACVAVFILGLMAFRQGWVQEIPDDIQGRCCAVTAVAAVTAAGLLAGAGLSDHFDDLFGGWNLWAAGFAALDAVLCVFGSVWLLSVAQRRLTRPLPHGQALGRSAYAAFIVQTPVLIALALALRPVGLPAEAKALLVAVGGIAGSYSLAWGLTRIPGVRRIL